jgi:alpha-tubulin suppressor-like RCC1 family protein
VSRGSKLVAVSLVFGACGRIGYDAAYDEVDASAVMGGGDADAETEGPLSSTCAEGLDARRSHTCLRTVGGAVWCWGLNGHRQLGDGASSGSNATPVLAANLPAGVEQVGAGGFHTCARRANGIAHCLGANYNGQLGSGAGPSSPSALQVTGPLLREIATGDETSCLLANDTTVHCWGRNDAAQVGDGTSMTRPTPVPVGISGVVEIAPGIKNTCARSTTDLWCWGGNDYNQVAAGSTTRIATPTTIPLGWASEVIQVGVGTDHVCALRSDQKLWCWGGNYAGQLGDGTMSSRASPAAAAVTGVTQFALGIHHSCARRSDGTVWCWGDNDEGQVGGTPGGLQTMPRQVALPRAALRVAAGWRHSCALLDDRSITCWGTNDQGELGNGTTNPDPGPTAVAYAGCS